MRRIEIEGYLTPEEARAAGVRWTPRYRFENARDRLNAATVLLTPAHRNVTTVGWLCNICARLPLKDAERWSWLGCRICFAVDARVAERLGGKRFIPLGRHSIMNGAGVRLSTLKGPGLTAQLEGVQVMWASWDLLFEWGAAEVARLVAEAKGRLDEPADAVPFPQWEEWFPAGRGASANAYAAMLALQYPSLIEAYPEFGDAQWLAESPASSPDQQ
jgi:hypothetical protein